MGRKRVILERMTRGRAGFTFVEVMVALLIAVIAGIGIYSVYLTQQRQSLSQQNYNQLQNDLLYAMDFMKNELFLAGYQAVKDQKKPISLAGQHSVQFEYLDENAVPPDYSTKNIQVKYYLDGAGPYTLKREVQVWNGATFQKLAHAATTLPDQILAKNIEELSFEFRKDNDVLAAFDQAPAADPDPTALEAGQLETIRTVGITLRGRSERSDPLLKKEGRLTLHSEVKIRNLDITSRALDTSPPAVPAGLEAWDPQQCGRLQLQWNANTDPDLYGYVVYYGLAPGDYANRTRISRSPATAAGQKETLTLTDIVSTKSTDAVASTYYIAVAAFDRSGNTSDRSADVSGNPNPSVTGAAGADDTTSNPSLPDPPPDFAVAEGANENEIQLAWSAPSNPGVVGYRLYRSTDRALLDRLPVAAELVASETLLKADVTSYTDAGLIGCMTYYYKLCTIHCDPTLAATYTNAQFAVAYGNGPADGDDFPTATVSDSTPRDSLPPTLPEIHASPGYLRIILSLNNPRRSGTPPVSPDFAFTEIWFNKGLAENYPSLNDATGQIENGTLIPDTEVTGERGRFSGDGTRPAINFDSETRAGTGPPELEPNQTYYFLAIAYDQCGNATPDTGTARAAGTQCGDCFSHEGLCYEAPPAPENLRTDAGQGGCDGNIFLRWDPLSEIIYRDFAGYRVLRREGKTWEGGSNEVNLTGNATTGENNAIWFSYFDDTSVEPGVYYSYKVIASDCYYERYLVEPAMAWQETSPGSGELNNPADNSSFSLIEGLYVGGPVVSATRRNPVTGGLTDTPPNLRHNTVLTWMDNKAPGELTLGSLTLAWDHATAYLRKAVIGDDATTARTLVYDRTPPLTASSTGTTVTTNLTMDGADLEIPFAYDFAKEDGSLDAEPNMRERWLTTTLSWRNPTTGASCDAVEKISVPLGPMVMSVTQDSPDAATPAWPVPGDLGTNAKDHVVVPGGVPVHVFTRIYDASFAGIAGVKLSYFVDSGAHLLAAPTDPAVYTPITLYAWPGETWSTKSFTDPAVGSPIPAADGSNVWYAVVAVDNDGNFDRGPEWDSGAFQYYQQVSDVCSSTPRAPTLQGTTSGATVVLSWTPPTSNTDGSAFSDGGGYRLYRSTDGTNYTLWQSFGAASLSAVDSSPELESVGYSYAVTALDTCAPTPNESARSNVYAECIGPQSEQLLLSPGTTPFSPGDTFGITLQICTRQNGATGEQLWAQVCSVNGGDAKSILLTEEGDTGHFLVDSSNGGAVIRTYDAAHAPGSPAAVDIQVNPTPTDTVTVVGYREYAAGPYGNTCQTGTVTSSLTVHASSDPCQSPQTPSAPVLTGVPDGSCIGNDPTSTMQLSWAPYNDGLATHFAIYHCVDTGSTACDPTSLVSEVGAGTTAVSVVEGGALRSNTYRYLVRAVNKRCSDAAKQPASSSNLVADDCK